MKLCLVALTGVMLAACALSADQPEPLPATLRVAVAPVLMPEPLPAPRARAQSAAMTLDDAQRMALENHPLLARAAARVDAARGKWWQVGLRPNPELVYEGNEINAHGQAGQQGLFLSREFLPGGKLPLRRAVAAQEIVLAEQQWAAGRMRVLADVRMAYYDVVVAQRQISLARELEKVSGEFVDIAKQLKQAKLVSDVDVLQAQIEADSAAIRNDEARTRHGAAWRTFALLVGAADMPPRALDDDLDTSTDSLDWESSLRRMMEESPQMAAAMTAVERAEWDLRRAVAEATPNFNVQAGVQYDFDLRETQYGVQVRLPLLLCDRNQGNIMRAESQLRAARSEAQRVRLRLRRQLSGEYERYLNARRRIDRYSTRIIPNAQRSLELITRGYKASLLTYATLLTGQRTLFEARLARLEALGQLRSTLAKIDSFLLQGSLDGEANEN